MKHLMILFLLLPTLAAAATLPTIAVYPIHPSGYSELLTPRIERKILEHSSLRLMTITLPPGSDSLFSANFIAPRRLPVAVDFLCTGTISQTNQKLLLTLKIIDIPHRHLCAIVQYPCTIETLPHISDTAVDTLLQQLTNTTNAMAPIHSTYTDSSHPTQTKEATPAQSSSVEAAHDSLPSSAVTTTPLQQSRSQWNSIAIGGFMLLSLMMLITFSAKQ